VASEPSDSIKDEKFRVKLSCCQIFDKDYASRREFVFYDVLDGRLLLLVAKKLF
jgi:hypothetical protein